MPVFLLTGLHLKFCSLCLENRPQRSSEGNDPLLWKAELRNPKEKWPRNLLQDGTRLGSYRVNQPITPLQTPDHFSKSCTYQSNLQPFNTKNLTNNLRCIKTKSLTNQKWCTFPYWILWQIRPRCDGMIGWAAPLFCEPDQALSRNSDSLICLKNSTEFPLHSFVTFHQHFSPFYSFQEEFLWFYNASITSIPNTKIIFGIFCTVISIKIQWHTELNKSKTQKQQNYIFFQLFFIRYW